MAGGLGALMAMLDISIVNSSLPTIQGEIGASGTEGTWVGTAYLVAEIVSIPMAGWFQRLLGVRTFLIVFATLFVIFSVVCGLSTSLGMMVAGRVGQGFTGGPMIPTAHTIIAQRLPPRQQPIGVALFGLTAVMGPLLGPVIGGWMTENLSWHYAFFINLPIGIILVLLLLFGLKHEPARLDLLREADWLGIAGLALGLGGMTVVLEDGQREQWFASATICWMTAVSAFGFVLLFTGQVTRKRPIVKLSLLLDRQFGSVALMGMAFGMVLYGTTYAIPQFLAAIPSYNAIQAGKVVLLSGIPAFLLLPFVPILLRTVNIRVAVSFGLILMSVSAFHDATLSADTSGSAFTISQLMRGAGQLLSVVFLTQAVVRSVAREDAGDATGLFNAARNLGGSFGLAGIGILHDQRLWFHSRRLEESLNANSVAVQDYVASWAQRLGDAHAALRAVSQQVQTQALVMTYNDIFWVMGVATGLLLPLVMFLRPLPTDAQRAAMH